MNCEKFQDLILTDYLDGQMGEEQRKDLEGHIASCAQCKEFELAARKTVIEPFTQAEKITPSEAVWQQIKVTIEDQKEDDGLEGSLVNDFIRILKGFVTIPKPAFALAMAVVIALVLHTATKTTSNHQGAGIQPQDQVEYIAYLIDETDAFSNETNGDYGTAIEEYFL